MLEKPSDLKVKKGEVLLDTDRIPYLHFPLWNIKEILLGKTIPSGRIKGAAFHIQDVFPKIIPEESSKPCRRVLSDEIKRNKNQWESKKIYWNLFYF